MEEKKPVKVPFTKKPEDVLKLFLTIASTEIPKDQVTVDYFKSQGFSTSSSNYLLEIIRMLGFLDEEDKPSSQWQAYLAEEKRGLTLAASIKKAYDDLFENSFCPYLEDDEVLLDYFKRHVESSPRDLELMLQTFRNLSELADFQDIMCEEGGPKAPAALAETNPSLTEVKVNPNLQLNIQIHIDPNTSDEKIETIFRNMRKYLLGRENS